MTDSEPLDRIPPGTFVDMDGRPITTLEWAELYERGVEARTLAYDDLGAVGVRTVWTGLWDPGGGELPFGTALLRGGRFAEELRQYGTKDGALAGHREAVNRIRASRQQEPRP